MKGFKCLLGDGNLLLLLRQQAQAQLGISFQRRHSTRPRNSEALASLVRGNVELARACKVLRQPAACCIRGLVVAGTEAVLRDGEVALQRPQRVLVGGDGRLVVRREVEHLREGLHLAGDEQLEACSLARGAAGGGRLDDCRVVGGNVDGAQLACLGPGQGPRAAEGVGNAVSPAASTAGAHTRRTCALLSKARLQAALLGNGGEVGGHGGLQWSSRLEHGVAKPRQKAKTNDHKAVQRCRPCTCLTSKRE